MENVPDVIGSKNIEHFSQWLSKLESLGYKCYYDVLNSKHYGIPQNRERCFMVSILGDYYYSFPKPVKLGHKLCNLLQPIVDEKYYLSDKMVQYINANNEKWTGNTRADCSDYLCEELPSNCNLKNVQSLFTETQAGMITKDGNIKRYLDSDIVDKFDINQCADISFPNGYNKACRVHDECPALNTTTTSSSFIVKQQVGCEIRCDEGIRTFSDDCMGTLRTIDACGGKHIIESNLKTQLCNNLIKSGILKEGYVESTDGVCNTLTTRPDVLGVVVNSNNKRLQKRANKIDCNDETLAIDAYNQVCHTEMQTIKTNFDTSNMNFIYNNYRIRKLTPLECFRLMAIEDTDFLKIAENQSNASLYHLAGDSIVVSVLVAIFGTMVDGFKFDNYLNNFYKQMDNGENNENGRKRQKDNT